MGKDRRSRSRKPSENKQDPASRSASAATAVRVPLPSSSPTFGSVLGDTSDHEEKMQAEPNADGASSPQDLESSQNKDPSQVSVEPVLTDDGSPSSPHIEPNLGEIVEESTNGRAAEDTQSPTNTDQSISPDAQKPLYNLGAELDGASSDGSEGDMQSEEGDQGKSPAAAHTESVPAAEEPQKPQDDNSGQAENIRDEKRKRLAAEERVRTLKAEMKAQRQRFEEEAERAKKKHEHALQRANQAREADKVKLQKKADQKIQAEVDKYVKNVDLHGVLTAQIREATEQSATGDDAGGDVPSLKKTAATENGERLQAIKNQISASLQRAPIEGLPRSGKRDLVRPGNARFILAQAEYLLDKSSPVYNALLIMANFADGTGELPNDENTHRLEEFADLLQEGNETMEDYMGRPNECLLEMKRDWKLTADTWKQGSSKES